MGNAPRNIAPGRHALGRNQIGHIIKGHHIALERAIMAAPLGHAHQQIFQASIAGYAHFFLQGFIRAVLHPVKHRRKFRNRHRQRQRCLLFVPIQQPLGRAVYKGHAPSVIYPNHTRCDRGQNRIEQPPAPFDLAGVIQQRLALALQLPRHLVKILAEHGNLVIALFLDHLHIQIARAHLLRSPRQTPHGAAETLGKPQAQQHSRQDQKHRKAQIKQRKIRQAAATLAFLLLIKPRGFLGFIQKRQQIAIDRAADIQKPLAQAAQLNQGAIFIIWPIADQRHALAARGIKIAGRWHLEVK